MHCNIRFSLYLFFHFPLHQISLHLIANECMKKRLIYKPEWSGEYWRLLTYMLLHADVWHLTLNICLQVSHSLRANNNNNNNKDIFWEYLCLKLHNFSWKKCKEKYIFNVLLASRFVIKTQIIKLNLFRRFSVNQTKLITNLINSLCSFNIKYIIK